MNKYKGIVLAGGKGTRLYPITRSVTKSMLPVYDKPLIHYPLATLMMAGIKEILIVHNPDDVEAFRSSLGNGSKWGIRLRYAIQDDPRGIADAFLVDDKFVGDSHVCLVLGDNIFHGQSLSNIIADGIGYADDNHATVVTYEVAHPERYGVATFKDDKITHIEEKPSKPKSNHAVTGLYFYPPDVVDIARNLKPSDRGELEITDVNKQYLAEDRLSCIKLGRGATWLDAGTFDSLLDASNFVATIEKRQGNKIACLEEVALRMGYIDSKQCLALATEYPNDYGKYLLKLAASVS